jgi:formylglycine-generating enzyme required for sulfatase activity
MSRIFISYRRADSAATCGRLYERLAAHFGKDAVFKDVDDIPYGVRFPDYLADKLKECRVELVIIGKQWLTLTTPDGARRLDDPNDFVRIEIEAGLRNGLIVIPVLVDNATLPHADDLPESLRELIEFHAAQVRYDPDFSTDVDRLIRQLDRWLGVTQTSTPPPAMTSTPSAVPTRPTPDPQTARIEQQMQRLRAAYEAQDWYQVIDTAEYLQAETPADALPAELYRLLGQAQYARENNSAALSAFTIALQRDRDDVTTLALAAHTALLLKDETNAAQWLKRGLGLPARPDERANLLHLYLLLLQQQAQWNELLWRCDEYARLRPEEKLALSMRLDALTHLNRDADALAVARSLTARPDATAEDWLARARLARSVADDDAEVRSCLDTAGRLAPNNPAVVQARRELLPPPAPPIASDHFPERLASLGFVGKTAIVDGKSIEYIVPPLCAIPAGPFLMGDDKHSVTLPDYQIARYPVTVAEYACFVRAGYAEPAGWQTQLGYLDHPVVSISWHDATAYAAWLVERTGQPWRLPSEAEWEKAARGSDGREYPWGNHFDQNRCNTSESGIGGTTPVGSYVAGRQIIFPTGERQTLQSGASPYEVEDLAGNVWEWTESRYDNSTENVCCVAAAGAIAPGTLARPLATTSRRTTSMSTLDSASSLRRLVQ